MVKRVVFVVVVFLGLAGPGIASGNAVLLEGAEGEVVRTARQEIQIQVRAQVATTTVTTTFEPLTEPHALFCFGIPDQAAAYELVAFVDGEELAAETVVGDPGEYPGDMSGWIAEDLVHYLGDNPLRTWIHEVPVGAELQFRLTYVELLPYSFGRVTYMFPMVPFGGDTEPIEELVIDFELLTERTLESFAINVEGAEVEEISDAHVTASSTESMVPRYQNLVASYEVRQAGMGMRLWAYRPEENPWVDEFDGYFLLLLEPPTESDEVSSKVFTYVLDRSGSMKGDKIVSARNAAVTAIAGLNAGDKFNIIGFDTDIDYLASAPLDATWDNRNRAIEFVEGIDAEGSTAIHAALLSGLSEDIENLDLGGSGDSVDVEVWEEPRGGCHAFLPGPHRAATADESDDVKQGSWEGTEGLPRVMLFLTDGLPTVGIEDPMQILADVNAANVNATAIYSVAIGHDADAHFLGALSEQNRAISVEVLNSNALQDQLEELFFRVNNPLLVRPGIGIQGGAVHDRLPKELPDLFLGNQLVIVGRYGAPGPVDIELSGELDGQPTSYEYEGELPSNEEQNTFVGRIWAVTMVRHLLSVIEAEGETEELVDKVTELGLAYGINTPYTPFSFEPSGDDDDDDDATGDDDDTYAADDDGDMSGPNAHKSADDCSCRLDGLVRHRSLVGLLLLAAILAHRSRRRF